MTKVILGKRYNTETAEVIGSFDNGIGVNDFNHLRETLYRTKKGAYFLYGAGGANSRYSEGNGNSRWGSSLIISFTKDDAFKWCQRSADGSEWEEHFSDMIEEA